MKQGYIQLDLESASSYITKFYTHKGLKRFERLNFGTRSAAEIFHEEIKKDILTLKYDDVIVHGKTQI